MLEPEQRSTSHELPDNNHLRIGLNRWLQIFITQSFYIFIVRPNSSPSNVDEGSVSSQNSTSSSSSAQTEFSLREKSIIGLVNFYKKLPQRHIPDRSTWYLPASSLHENSTISAYF